MGRQDAAGFEREINEFHTQKDSVQPVTEGGHERNQEAKKLKDATTNLASNEAWDEKFNPTTSILPTTTQKEKQKRHPMEYPNTAKRTRVTLGVELLPTLTTTPAIK